MKNLSTMAALLLIATLNACSSGSSDASAPSANTNTVPANGNSTEANTPSQSSNSQSDANQQTDAQATGEQLSEDQPDGTGNSDTDTGDNENSDAENSSDTNADTDTDTDADADADDSETGTDENAVTGNGDNGATGAENENGGDGDGNNGSENNENNNLDSETQSTDIPSIDTNTPLGQMQQRIQTLASIPVLGLNQKLSEGEMLSEQENQCLGFYDPAIGEPLLAVKCSQPLAIGSSVPIFTSIAELADSTACRSSLQNANADNCTTAKASFTIATLWIIPEVQPGQPERPSPDAGAFLQYNVVANQLSIENLPDAFSGVFNCTYQLSDGTPISNDQVGDCDKQLKRVTALIDKHLSQAL